MVVEVLQPDTEEKDGAADVLQRGGVRAAPAHSQRVVGVPAIQDKYRLYDKILERRFDCFTGMISNVLVSTIAYLRRSRSGQWERRESQTGPASGTRLLCCRSSTCSASSPVTM